MDRKGKVLVVEGRKGRLALLKDFFSARGFETGTAPTVREALAAAEQSSFLILVLDALLPELRGPELAERLQQVWPGASVGLIVPQADRGGIALESPLKQGATSFLLDREDWTHFLEGLARGASAALPPRENESGDNGPAASLASTHGMLLEEIVEAVPLLLFLYSPKARKVLFANRAAERALGWPPEKISAMEDRFFELIHPEDRDYLEDIFNNPPKGSGAEVEHRMNDSSGAWRWFRTRVQRFSSAPDGSPLLSLGVAEDITLLKNSSDEARRRQEENQMNLRAMSSTLAAFEERDRRRLATELHENLAQLLAMSKIGLQTAIRSATGDESKAELGRVRDLIDKSIQFTRSLTLDLSCPVFYELGLGPALEAVAEELDSREGIRVKYRRRGDTPPIDHELGIFLYRCVRSLVLSALEHSNIEQVLIDVEDRRNSLHVTVEERGKASGPAKVLAGEGGVGLFGMQERLAYYGGRMAIEVQPGRGVSISLIVPLQREQGEGPHSKGNAHGDKNHSGR